MANLLILFVFLFVPVIVSSRAASKSPLYLTGTVYCDTCRLGFETEASTPIARATVKVECKSKDNAVVYSETALTNERGEYAFYVKDDHIAETCDTVLVSSSRGDCKTADLGRDRARVILNRDNGMVSDQRFANSMGFLKDHAPPECAQIVRSFQEIED